MESLWFNGVVVVAAAGNYGVANTPQVVSYAPGNDPFVITVGATETQSTKTAGDDTVAPWSAYGHTLDGFAKPEISAPGRMHHLDRADGLDACDDRSRPRGRARLHVDVRNVALGADRCGRCRAGARAAPELDARPGEGRADGVREPAPGCRRLRRRRR